MILCGIQMLSPLGTSHPVLELLQSYYTGSDSDTLSAFHTAE
jgi:hypothetical protein